MFTQWLLPVHPHQDILLSFKCICSPFDFCYLFRKGAMKRNCLNRPGQGPASRALTPKVSTHLRCSRRKQCLGGTQDASRPSLTVPQSRQSFCLPVFWSAGKRKWFSGAGTQRCRQCPSSPCTPAAGSRSAPAASPSRGHCADEGRAALPETTSVDQPLHRCPPAPGKLQSRISGCSLNTEWQGTNRKTGCGKGRPRQREGLLFLGTPAMTFYWSSQA